MRLYKNAVLRLDQRHDLDDSCATIDVDGHRAIAEVVVRMEDQTDDSPELVAFAGRLVACYNLLDGYDTKAFEGMTLAEFVAKQAYLSEITTHDGLSITLSGLAMQMVAASFAGQFKANGASNYLEISASHPDTGPFTITMQRKEGVTPIMKLEAMTKQRDAAYVMAGKSGLERDKFAQQLKAANRQIAAMAELLRGASPFLDYVQSGDCHLSNDDISEAIKLSDRIAAALAGELPDHVADASKMVPEGAGSRALFERWFRRDYHPDRQGPYIKDITWAAWQAALADAPLTTCARCNGHGMIGGVTGQTPESMDFWEAACPECDGRGKIHVVTEGWRLVPVEPTPEMIQSACDSERLPLPMWARMTEVYRAMLAAAPRPQGGAPCDTGLPSSKSD